MTAVPPPDAHQFKLGSCTVTVIKDGASVMDNPWEIFGSNQAPDTVRKLLEQNLLPTEKLVNSYTPAIIDTGSDVIVVDTGIGAAGRARGLGRFREGLKAVGYTPEQVTVVALTHLHGDHIGGLMEDGVPAFPNARYVAGEIEYGFWTDKAREGTPAEGGQKSVLANVVPFAEKMTFLRDGDQIVSGMTAMLAWSHARPSRVSSGIGRQAACHDRRYRQSLYPVRRPSGLGSPLRCG